MEESPPAMDCTTLALVDATESQSALPIAENKDSGVEPIISPEDTSPAAPPLQTFTNTEIFNILDDARQGICPPKDAIAVLLKTSHARSLMGAINSNPQWGIKLSDYSTVPQDSKLRSQREARLKSYATLGECPPEEFLLECQNDPMLKIQISRLAARQNWDIQRNIDHVKNFSPGYIP